MIRLTVFNQGGGVDKTTTAVPVMRDHRLTITDTVLNTLAAISEKRGVPIYGGIRTYQSVGKAARGRQFLADYDPLSKALEDYETLYPPGQAHG
jgi:chromosome partitioning protein